MKNLVFFKLSLMVFSFLLVSSAPEISRAAAKKDVKFEEKSEAYEEMLTKISTFKTKSKDFNDKVIRFKTLKPETKNIQELQDKLINDGEELKRDLKDLQKNKAKVVGILFSNIREGNRSVYGKKMHNKMTSQSQQFRNRTIKNKFNLNLLNIVEQNSDQSLLQKIELAKELRANAKNSLSSTELELKNALKKRSFWKRHFTKYSDNIIQMKNNIAEYKQTIAFYDDYIQAIESDYLAEAYRYFSIYDSSLYERSQKTNHFQDGLIFSNFLNRFTQISASSQTSNDEKTPLITHPTCYSYQ